MARPLPRLSTRLRDQRLRLAVGLATGQVAGRGALALALLAIVRNLDKHDFGDLAFMLALIAVLITVADAGFARLLIRDASRESEAHRDVVLPILWVRLICVATTVALSAAVLLVVPDPFTATTAVLGLVYLLLESVSFGFENAAVGAERPQRFVVAQVFGGAVLLGSIAILALNDAITLQSSLAALVAGSAAKTAGHIVAWRAWEVPHARDRLPRRETVAAALPFLGLTVLATVYYRVGIVVLHSLRGPQETASYAAAFRIIDVVAIGAGIIFASASPTLSRAHRDRPEQLEVMWRRLSIRVLIVAVPLGAVVVLAAEPICGFLFGARYRVPAAEDLRLLIPGAVLMLAQASSAAVVFMADDHRMVIRLTTLNLTACVGLSVVFTNRWGSQGTALALTAAEALSFVSFAVLITRRYGAVARHHRDHGSDEDARP